MTNEDYLAKRLAELRTNANVSARDMSLSIGQSESYINKIENGKSFPSMQTFFYICDFLKITPKEFFDTDVTDPNAVKQANAYLEKLNSDELENIMNLVKNIINAKK